jgi:hypothetical protein
VKIEVSVSDIRGLLQVGPTSDRKGNPVAVVELLGVPILYADHRDLPHQDWEIWEDVVGAQLGNFFAAFLMGSGVMDDWKQNKDVDREVRRLSPREEYLDEDH